MRERTQRIGGTLSVKSRPGAGTEVVLELAVVEPESMAA
jgi:signal transduction histidine kinase